MFSDIGIVREFELCTARRKYLCARVQEQFSDDGLIVLLAGFESERYKFVQESSFWYFSGIDEPSTALSLTLDGQTCLYLPNCTVDRSQWVHSPVELTQENAKALDLDEVTFLGQACPGYQFSPFLPEAMYSTLIARIREAVAAGKKLYTLAPSDSYQYLEQRMLLNRLASFIPGLSDCVVDISPIVAQMRCRKDREEIEYIHEAVQLTQSAHEVAATMIKPGVLESEVQAGAQYIMTAEGGLPSFPSIVASGSNSTILHYTTNDSELKKDTLVVVDIGAQLNHYCADLTRTYPVSGKFTPRQKEIYNLVLEAQQLIADMARPGIWLKNKEKPEESLHHIAVEFFKKKGYEQYFPHGIGHYLGLDVHDVGDYSRPLREGDVITIEPGLYLPEERIGVRIEDNYWIVKNGAICLSDGLPKTANEIEQFVQVGFGEDDEEGDLDDPEFLDDDSSEFEGFSH